MEEFGRASNLPWPGNKDKMFSEGSPLNFSVAVLDDWLKRSGCDALLPDAYKEAADMIVSCVEEGRTKYHYPGMYFFTIAYMYRHSFELCLKRLIYQGVKLGILKEDDELKKVLAEHKLYPLWNKVRFVLEEVWPNENQNDIKNVDRIIQELRNIDESGQNFRYSKDRRGVPTTVKLPMTVDLSEMKKVCNNLFSFFTACEDALSEVL
jgi:hypothetical protein